MTAENILSVLGSIAVIGSVIVQAINLVDLIRMDQYLKKKDREAAKKFWEEYEQREQRETKEREKALSELPDWAEKWIDDYLNS